MKAVVQERYGRARDVLELRELPTPAPQPGEVRLGVRAAAVAGDDAHLMRGEPYIARLELGLLRPKQRVAGVDVAGVVEACGAGVDGWAPGDEVFGWCAGAFAEWACTPAHTLARKPEGLPFADAAAVPTTGLTALQALRDTGAVEAGQRVLVIGASGGVGTLAIQIARQLGAEVTAVCSTGKVPLVLELGAHEVIDYTRESLSARGGAYDLILYLGGRRSLAECRRVLTGNGTLVLVGGAGGRVLGGVRRWVQALALSPFTRQRLRPFVHQKRSEDLATLAGWLGAGTLRPVVGARYPFPEFRRALEHFEEGHATGRVVLTFGEGATL